MTQPSRYALLGGLGPDAGLIQLRSCLATGLGPDHAFERPDLLDQPESFTGQAVFQRLSARLDAPPDQHLWVVLAGEALDVWGQVVVRTGEPLPQGLSLPMLCNLLGQVPAARLVLAIDLGHEDAADDLPPGARRLGPADLAALPWPACALRVVGRGLSTRLVAALTTGEPGPRKPCHGPAGTARRRDPRTHGRRSEREEGEGRIV